MSSTPTKPITVLAYPGHVKRPFTGDRKRNFYVRLNAIPEDQIDHSVGDGSPGHTEAVTTDCFAFNDHYITWVCDSYYNLDRVLKEATQKYPYFWRDARVILNFSLDDLRRKEQQHADDVLFVARTNGVSIYPVDVRQPALKLVEMYHRFIGDVDENAYDGVYDPDANADRQTVRRSGDVMLERLLAMGITTLDEMDTDDDEDVIERATKFIEAIDLDDDLDI